MPDATRLEQFQKMAEADPENELAHFSLGREYLEQGMLDLAIASLERTLDLNPNMSRAYQLLGTALLNKGLKGPAIDRLMQGVRIAHARGELMPRNDMMRALRDLGATPPDLGQQAAQQPIGEGEVLCQRCQRVAAKLASPPFRGPQGQQIHEKICAGCWRDWMAMSTKVINELRLSLADPQAQKIWETHMIEFLNLR